MCCFPGIRDQDISEKLQDGGDKDKPEVTMHIGTNDIGRKGDEVLQREYKDQAKGFKRRIVISGLLSEPCGELVAEELWLAQ